LRAQIEVRAKSASDLVGIGVKNGIFQKKY
jgi:hypothetical protein